MSFVDFILLICVWLRTIPALRRSVTGGSVFRAAVLHETVGTRRLHTVDGNTGVFRIQTTQTGAAGIRFDILHLDSGKILEELTDVAFGHVAEHVGGDGTPQIHRVALLHQGLGVAFDFCGDHIGRQRDRTVARDRPRLRRSQLDFDRHGLPGGNDERGARLGEPDIRHHDLAGAGGHAGETEGASRTARAGDRGTHHADFRVTDILARGGIEHPPGHRAGGCNLRAREGNEEEGQKGREEYLEMAEA